MFAPLHGVSEIAGGGTMTQQTLTEQTDVPPDLVDRAARVAEVKIKLQACQQELDELGLWQAGAHLSLALHAMEPKA